MMHIIAELPDPTSAQSIGFIALALFSLIAGINQILRLTDRFRTQPPPHLTYATKKEHDQQVAKCAQDQKDMEKRFGETITAERRARKEIHEQIGVLTTELASVKSETRQQTSALDDLRDQQGKMNERIDAIPQRTISLLRETQQLHSR